MSTTVEVKSQTAVPAASSSLRGAPSAKLSRRDTLLLAGLGAVVLVAGGLWFAFASGKSKEQYAQRQLDQARAAGEAGNLPLAASEFQKVATNFKGTDAGQQAILALNQARIINDQNELAAQGLREFLAQKPSSEHVAPANALLGTALENANKPAEAAEAYRAAAAAAVPEFLKAEYLSEAGRSFLDAGRTKDAEAVYREIVQKYDKTPTVTEAKVRLAELTKGAM